MSTKIYEAYRFPKEKLNDFLYLTDEKILSYILEYGNNLFNNLTEKSINEVLKKKDMEDLDFSNLFKREIAFEYYVKKAMNSDERNVMDLSASFNFWIRKNYVYTIPYIENWIYKDLDYPDWVEEYSYWNNTDKPRNISDKEWNERRELWSQINNNWDKGRLIHHIMNVSGNRWYKLINYIREKNKKESE